MGHISPTSDRSGGLGDQLSLDGLDQDTVGIPLRETTFVVVDLETTGGSADRDRITEIGAVKVRGGDILGEFATLVDPGREIPPQIVRLTGITEAMVYAAPRIEEVLPAFLEFSRGAVLVAHNARFDIGFLRAAAGRVGRPWPRHRVLCTVQLARRVLTREEAPTVKLSALARLFAASTTPTHRALDDARATVDVLHGLLGRVGNVGVQTYGDLTDFLPGLTAAQRSKRRMTDHIPARPGVYLFRGPGGEVLYVGTATDLRRRTRQYFTGAETRTRMREMITLATAVDHVECAHRLEAGVRELRLLAAHRPAYNRRSMTPFRGWWVALTEEAFPRLIVTRTPSAEVAVGPIRSRSDATAIVDLISRCCALRTCTRRIPASGTHWCHPGPDGALPVGGCRGASAEPTDATAYRPVVQRAAGVLTGADDTPLTRVLDRLLTLSAAEMFETAARTRDRLTLTVTALERCQRLTALCRIAELVAAAPDGAGGWDLAVVRHGRLAAAGVARRGVPPMPVAAHLVASAQTVPIGPGPLRGAAPEEAGVIYRWLTDSGARMVSSTDGFAMPIASAARWTDWRATAADAQADERRARTASTATTTPAPDRTTRFPEGRRLQLTG